MTIQELKQYFISWTGCKEQHLTITDTTVCVPIYFVEETFRIIGNIETGKLTLVDNKNEIKEDVINFQGFTRLCFHVLFEATR